MVSHELRTPLNAIVGFSQITREDARKGDLSPAHVDFAEEIHASGVHPMDIVNDLPEPAAIFEAVKPPALFDACLRRCGSAARERKATVGAATIEAPELSTDRGLPKRSLDHLLDNAAKFTPPGGRVTPAVRRCGEEPEIVVKDTGVGSADLRRVFEPFWRAAPTITRSRQGAGLGLTVVKSAAESLGDAVRLESAPGDGVAAMISPPLRPAAFDGTVALPSPR